jgi:hypothetical protein
MKQKTQIDKQIEQTMELGLSKEQAVGKCIDNLAATIIEQIDDDGDTVKGEVIDKLLMAFNDSTGIDVKWYTSLQCMDNAVTFRNGTGIRFDNTTMMKIQANFNDTEISTMFLLADDLFIDGCKKFKKLLESNIRNLFLKIYNTQNQ